VIARADHYYFPPVPIRFNSGRSAVLAASLMILALAAAFVVAVGDPVRWTSDRVDEFEAGGGATASGSKFTGGFGSNRNDFWRVAIDELGDDPLKGDGAGGFRYAYLAERDSDETPDDPHGIEFTMAAELGLPGVLLVATLLALATVGAIRSWRLGPSAQLLTAAALSAGACWLVSSGYDWNWTFPALTAPVLALLGAACAPALLDPTPRRPAARIASAVAAVALAVTMVPLYLSERYADNAYSGWREDLSRAYEDLDRAADLNPLSDRPLLGKALIAREANDRAVALDSLERAIDRKPAEWSAHYYLGTLVLEDDPARAATELETAGRLNPRNEGIAAALAGLGPATR
jgi:hypothetical protein